MADPGEHQICQFHLDVGFVTSSLVYRIFHGLIDWLVCFCLDGYDIFIFTYNDMQLHNPL